MAECYNPEKVLGKKMTFVCEYGMVWATVPSMSKHSLGSGKTKAEAKKYATKALKKMLTGRHKIGDILYSQR